MKTTRWARRALAAAVATVVGLTLALGTGSPAQGEDWLYVTAAQDLNGTPKAVVVDGTDIYVAGAFTLAGTVSANRIAKYDTTNGTWSALGTGADQSSGTPTISALAIDTTTTPHTLYAGGNFTQMGGVSATALAKWDGTNWTSVAPTGMVIDYSIGVNALAFDGSTLYAGGLFHYPGRLTVNMMQWDTRTSPATGWSLLGGSYVNSVVRTIAIDRATSPSTVYIGGDFNSGLQTRGNGSSIYQVDPAPIAPSDGALYPSPENLAKWNGTVWSAVNAGTCSITSVYSECGVYFSGRTSAARVWSLAVGSGKLYIGGEFGEAGGVSTNQVAMFDGTSFTQVGDGLTKKYYGFVNQLLLSGTNLYASGGGWNFTGYTNGAGHAVLDTTAGTPTWAALGTSDTAPGVGVALAKIGTDIYSFHSGGNVMCQKYVAKLVATGAGSSCAFTPFVPTPPRAPAAPAGDSTSPVSTPTTTPTPTVVIPVVAAIPPGTNSAIPAAGLTPGSSVMLVNGVPSTVTIKPDQPVQPKSLVATGDGFTMEIGGQDASGKPLGLTSDAALRLQRDNTASVKGSGFAPNVDVQVNIFSTATLLGTIRTDATGAFNGTVKVPAIIEPGRHTLQVGALTADNKVRTLSLGVVLEAPAKAVRTAKATVTFAPLSSTLSSTAKATLSALAKKTKATATGGLVVGYVQNYGDPANNSSLSKKRAAAIAAFLKAKGVTAPLGSRGNGAWTKKTNGRIATVSVSYTN